MPTRAIDPSQMDEATRKKFWMFVNVTNPSACWEWTGPIRTGGYGGFYLRGVSYRAHRISLFIHGIEMPAGMVVDHTCRNKLCVNPARLRVVSLVLNAMENTSNQIAANARKTHCYRGHPLSGENLYVRKAGFRVCKTCNQELTRQWRARRKAAMPPAAAKEGE